MIDAADFQWNVVGDFFHVGFQVTLLVLDFPSGVDSTFGFPRPGILPGFSSVRVVVTPRD